MKRGEIKTGSAWAVVTGAGSGIGRCYALRLSKLGYRVLLVGNKIEPLEKVQAEINASSPAKATYKSIDLARIEAAQELFDYTQQEKMNVDVLVNNAGMFSFCDILDTPQERIERLILLHDMTTTKTCRLFAEDMIQRKVRGHILNMASYSIWMPFPGMALYSASKAYLKSFSEAFSREVQDDGIRVTAICPAGVATDLYGLAPKLQRLGLRLGVLISPDNCARRGLRAMWKGRRVIVPDWWNRLWIPICKHLPMCILRPIRRRTMQFQK